MNLVSIFSKFHHLLFCFPHCCHFFWFTILCLCIHIKLSRNLALCFMTHRCNAFDVKRGLQLKQSANCAEILLFPGPSNHC
jgi:hypothetical protein